MGRSDERQRLQRTGTPEQLSDVFDNASVGIHLVGADGIILRANRCELEMLGYDWDEYVGHHISEFHVSQEAIENILQRLTNGEVLSNHEAQLRRKDGSVRDVLISSSVLWDNGRFVHTRCFTSDITDRRRSQDEQNLLIGEMRHRVRNTLSTVQAIASQTLPSATAEERAAFIARLHALAAAHDLLTADRWDRARLADVVGRALAPFEDAHGRRIMIGGPEVFVDAQHSLLLTLAFHELATNAIKYGALSNGSGQVRVSWDLAQGQRRVARLRWEEVGGPAVTAPVRTGFGSRLIERALDSDTHSTRLEYAPAGLQCSFEVPLSDNP